jgi:hypothetical protein
VQIYVGENEVFLLLTRFVAHVYHVYYVDHVHQNITDIAKLAIAANSGFLAMSTTPKRVITALTKGDDVTKTTVRSTKTKTTNVCKRDLG